MVPYNTAEGIESYLTDLTGLYRLFQERRAAGYDRGERLKDFCILGRWYLDSVGNSLKLETSGYVKSPASLGKCLPVMDKNQLDLFMRGESYGWSHTPPIPPPEAVCLSCQTGWTLDTAHDMSFRMVDNEHVFYHSQCRKLDVARRARVQMEEIFLAAGYPKANLHSISNEYWKLDEAEPWFFAQIGESPKIKIGWRKRVIQIDWSESLKNLLYLFEAEDVTKEAHLIHAWSPEKASEYLNKIIPALGVWLP